MLLGIARGVLFPSFAVALTALAAALTHSVVATAGSGLGALIGMVIAGRLIGIDPWLPTYLLGAIDGLVRGAAMERP